MNKRIALAILISLFIHWALFKIDFDALSKIKKVAPEIKQISVTMSYLEPAKPDDPPAKPMPPEKPKPVVKKWVQPLPVKAAPVKSGSVKPKLKPKAEKKVIKKKEQSVKTKPSRPETLPTPNPKEQEVVSTTVVEKHAPLPEINPAPHPSPTAAAKVKAVTKARPAFKKNPPPVYPKVARRRGHKGTVLLEVLVDKSGKVKKVRVDTSSGFQALDEAALKSVKSWIFEPGTINAQKVDMWVQLPIRFELH